MSRVLIWRRITQGSELDIFSPTDYSTLYDRVRKDWNGQSQNWGNRLWFQGIYSALDTGENTYDFLPEVIDADQINNEYDFIILSLANIFCTEYIHGLRSYTELFKKIRIPIYVIACGVQADSYDDLGNVIQAIETESMQFIQSIYNTGGEFALRGYFTNEFFERLGFHSAVVTGCPSLYQFGPDFVVTTEKEDISKMHPIFNGTIKPFEKLLGVYPDSIYMDQCDFFFPIYQPDYLRDVDCRFMLRFVDCFGKTAAQLLSEGRIIMIADMNDWWNYLQDMGFNYAFGTRIHGTIMSLLSGIPATIATIDSRTREMAEFFDIPRINMERHHCFTQKELLEAYQEMDYTAFNDGYRQRFESFKQFLVEHGIVSKVNTNNKFFVRGGSRSFESIIDSKRAEFADLSIKLKKAAPILNSAQLFRKVKRRVIS